MKLVIMYNEFDDYVLYVNGKAYRDIDYSWAECITWLSKNIANFSVESRFVDLQRSEYPDVIEQ